MNFIEVCKLLKLNKNLIMKRTNKSERIISNNYSLILESNYDEYSPSFEEILADDWYLITDKLNPLIEEILVDEMYEIKDIKLHTFEEAIAALKKGKAIKRECWITKEIDLDLSDEDYSITFTIDDFEANDWIIVGE